MAKKKAKIKKNGPNILPLLAIGIIAFLVYRANPEYWQQGRLLDDIRKGGVQKVEEEPIMREPVEQAEEVEQEPEVDPDASVEGSIKGAMTIPKNINKKISSTDPVYNFMRTKFRVIYVVLPESDSSKQLVADLHKARKDEGLKSEYIVESLLYTQDNKKSLCNASEPQAFLCKVCDKKICIINPRKKEFITVQPSVSGAVNLAKKYSGENW